jgi:hypothetical protein
MKTTIRISAVALVILLTGFQLMKTSLMITVRDETGNTVAGASVQLFENEEDYKEEKNVVLEGVTDEKGMLRFKELKAIPYYVIASKDDKDNSDGGEKTAKLDEKRINKITIIIQ